MENGIDCDAMLNNLNDFKGKTPVRICLTVIYSIIFVAGIIGNSLTIKVAKVLQSKGYLQKSIMDHLISLACADLLVLLLAMPVELYTARWDPSTTSTTNVACKIYNFLFETCSYATILHVATLSFERYVAICHPFKFKSFSGSRTVKLICFVWLTSFCVALPLLFAMGVEDPTIPFHNISSDICDFKKLNITICTNLSSHQIVFKLSIFSAFVLYIVILVSVAFMCKMMMKTLIGTKFNAAAKESEDLPKHGSGAMETSRKQSIIFLVLIVASLVVCWTPIQIRRIMAASKAKAKWTSTYFRTYVNILPVSHILFYLSSVLNPLLYNLSSKQFRVVFMRVLCCKSIEHINMRTQRRTRVKSKGSTNHSTSSLFHSTFKYTYPRQKSNKDLLRTVMKDTGVELQPLPHQNCDARKTKPDSGFNTVGSVSGPSLLKTNSELPSPEITSELHLIEQSNGVNETEI
ncbi:G-protein coupled receptor 39 [Cetorhinus maximus]